MHTFLSWRLALREITIYGSQNPIMDVSHSFVLFSWPKMPHSSLLHKLICKEHSRISQLWEIKVSDLINQRAVFIYIWSWIYLPWNDLLHLLQKINLDPFHISFLCSSRQQEWSEQCSDLACLWSGDAHKILQFLICNVLDCILGFIYPLSWVDVSNNFLWLVILLKWVFINLAHYSFMPYWLLILNSSCRSFGLLYHWPSFCLFNDFLSVYLCDHFWSLWWKCLGCRDSLSLILRFTSWFWSHIFCPHNFSEACWSWNCSIYWFPAWVSGHWLLVNCLCNRRFCRSI